MEDQYWDLSGGYSGHLLWVARTITGFSSPFGGDLSTGAGSKNDSTNFRLFAAGIRFFRLWCHCAEADESNSAGYLLLLSSILVSPSITLRKLRSCCWNWQTKLSGQEAPAARTSLVSFASAEHRNCTCEHSVNSSAKRSSRASIPLHIKEIRYELLLQLVLACQESLRQFAF